MAVPAPPKHLAASSKRLWRQLVADYRLDTEPHALRTLTLTCEAVDRAEEARSALATNGTTFLDRFGSPRARPEVAIERDSRIAALRGFRELSLDADTLPGEPRIPRINGARS